MTTRFSDLPLLSFGHTIQMVGAVYAGDGQSFLILFPDEEDKGPTVKPVEMSVDEWTQLLRQTDLLETEVTYQGPNGVVEKAIVRKSTRQIDQSVSWNVFRRDGYACRYCGGDKVPLTVDHLVLWEEGGPSIEANLLATCRKCNKARGNVRYGDWLKHPRYLETARRLSPEVRAANEAILPTLDAIPRVKNIRSR